MKKRMAVIISAVMLFTFVLSGCSGAGSSSSASSAGTGTEEAVSETAEEAADETPDGSGEAGSPSLPAGEEEAPAPAADYSDMKIAILLAGPANDNGWNASGYNAMVNIHDKYGLTEDMAYSESVAASDMEEFLRGYAQDGYNMIVGHGSQFVDAVQSVAPDFPDTCFIVSYAAEGTEQAPNVAGVGPVHSGMLAGAVAAAVSETKKIVMLGGEDTPSIAELVDAFEPGAKLVDPDIEVATAYIGTLTDADKAKEVALGYAAQGYDVLCASANNAGLGVLQAAEEAGIYAIGYNADQYEQAPGAVVTSVVRNISGMLENIFLEIAEGNFEPKIYAYDLGDGGTVLSDWHGWDEKLPEAKAIMDDFMEKVASGEYDY